MKTIVPIVLIIGIIVGVYFHKRLGLYKITSIRYVVLGIMVISIIACLTVVYTNASTSKNTYGWHTEYMQYKELHEVASGKGQKIALIDSGLSSFQVNDKRTTSVSLVNGEIDENGHGTMMYSLIRGYENSIMGIAPEAEIIAIKVMSEDEEIKPAIIKEAIQLAVTKGATIISLSLGSYNENEEIKELIIESIEKGITFVSSTGDYESADMLFPAKMKDVISVGSLSANLEVSHFTNAASEATIIAPGDEIKSIGIDKKVQYTSGTSQATAIISGYIALIKEKAMDNGFPLDNQKIIKLLESINKKELTYLDALLSIQ
ncbi:S8 family serine peptidase [Caldifermentibacillus hisashii]|uniref:S8 family serine peptidase n=2 Tax=Caldifermentibacillus hisashii TaxID=996558 RepID=A0ABU9K2B6_9BACI|nr:S8 family serine peptidase [Caldibacillus thermoamylovorans]